jgi:hypothetical protein
MIMLLEYLDLEMQSVESVVELLKFLRRPSDPLPEAVQLTGMVLVLSSKKDSYYVVTPKVCSCPSAFYRPGQRCKHQRKYFPGQEKSLEIEKKADEEAQKLYKAEWEGGLNGPVDPDLFEQKKAKQGQEA